MGYLSFIIGLLFLIVNILIITTDYKEKRIPNRYLCYLLLLLPLFFIITFPGNFAEFYLGEWLISILLTFILSFLLYSYGVWSAGDAKYLLVLSLYLPTIGIIPLIGNIALISIFYLFGYYLYFYTRFFFRGKHYISSFWQSVSRDKRDTWGMYLSKYVTHTSFFLGVFRFIFLFLLFFVSIRLLRGYLFTKAQNIEWLHTVILSNPTYALMLFGCIIFGIFYLFRSSTSRIKNYYIRKFSGTKYITIAENIFPTMLLVALMGYIYFEYHKDPDSMRHKLFLIFTIYLALFIIIKLLSYSYKVTFDLSEQDTIKLSQLRKGDIVDKVYLMKLFGTQKALGFNEERGILAPNPSMYFQKISNPIDGDTLLFLKKIYTTVNTHHKKLKTPGFEKLDNIKVLRTFAFGGYIFVGFLITYFLADAPLHFFTEKLLEFVKSMG